MSNIGKLSKVSLKKESTWGTAVTPDTPLSATGIQLSNKVDNVKDPRFVGEIYTSDLVKIGETVSGNIPLTSHPLEVGKMFDAVLMKNDTVAAAAQAYLVVYYVGPDAVATLDITASVISGKSGATIGTVAQKFGASGFDLTTPSYDTLLELVAAINAVAGGYWKAYLLGYQAAASPTLGTTYAATQFVLSPQFSAQILSCSSGSTTTKLHKVRPAGATDAEPSYTIMEDITLGANQALQYVGCKVSSLSTKMTAGTLVTMDASWSGKTESTGATYPALTIPIDTANTAGNARVFWGGMETTVARDLSLAIANALEAPKVVGSFFITEQTRGDATVTLTGTLNLVIADWIANYTNYYINNNPMEFLIYVQNKAYADATNHVYYNYLIRLPSVKLNEYKSQPTGPGRITSTLNGESIKNAVIDSSLGGTQIEVWVTDTITSSY